MLDRFDGVYALGDLGHGHAQCPGQGGAAGYVTHIMPTQQACGAAHSFAPGVDQLEGAALRVGGDVARRHIQGTFALILQAVESLGHLRPVVQGLAPGAVRREEGHTVRRQRLDQFVFGGGHRLEVVHGFQMLGAHAGNDAVARGN